MEIYHLRKRWLGFIFLVPALWFFLSLTGYTSFNIQDRERIVAYIVLTVCFIVSLQCFMGSTRFYFDNSSKNAVQIRRHFYGKKIVYIPYSDITAIDTRSYRRGNNTNVEYRVGLIEKSTQFGQPAQRFTTLRSYSGKEDSLMSAREFGMKICTYAKLNFIDDSEIVRSEIRNPG